MSAIANTENQVSQETASRGYLTPQVTITETKDGYVLEAEMPGVGKEGLEILLDGSELTLVGRRKPEAVNATLVYRESRPRDFRRVFELDPTIDAGRINAKIEHGVLRVDLPKAEQVKPRKITVSD